MAEVKKMSEGLVDMAERFADVVDAAQGRGARKASGGAKWLILPAAGAGVYALATSSSAFARRTRKLMSRAKDRATDLPDADLFAACRRSPAWSRVLQAAMANPEHKTKADSSKRLRPNSAAPEDQVNRIAEASCS